MRGIFSNISIISYRWKKRKFWRTKISCQKLLQDLTFSALNLKKKLTKKNCNKKFECSKLMLSIKKITLTGWKMQNAVKNYELFSVCGNQVFLAFFCVFQPQILSKSKTFKHLIEHLFCFMCLKVVHC